MDAAEEFQCADVATTMRQFSGFVAAVITAAGGCLVLLLMLGLVVARTFFLLQNTV